MMRVALFSLALYLLAPLVLDYARSHVQDEFDALKSKYEEEKRNSESVVASIGAELEMAKKRKSATCSLFYVGETDMCGHYTQQVAMWERDLASAKAGFAQEAPRMRLLEKWLNERSTLRQLIDLIKLRQ